MRMSAHASCMHTALSIRRIPSLLRNLLHLHDIRFNTNRMLHRSVFFTNRVRIYGLRLHVVCLPVYHACVYLTHKHRIYFRGFLTPGIGRYIFMGDISSMSYTTSLICTTQTNRYENLLLHHNPGLCVSYLYSLECHSEKEKIKCYFHNFQALGLVSIFFYHFLTRN